jgi:hypothetical protein
VPLVSKIILCVRESVLPLANFFAIIGAAENGSEHPIGKGNNFSFHLPKDYLTMHQ